MWKKLIVCLLAAVSFYSSLDAVAAETKRTRNRKKNKHEKKIEEVVWEKDIKSAVAKAKMSKKYVLLIHIAPGLNKESKLFDQNIVKNKSLARYSRELVFVKFEYESIKKAPKEAVEAAKMYPIEQRGNSFIMPTVYLLDGAGNVLDKKVGFQGKGPSEYIKSFKSIKKK